MQSRKNVPTMIALLVAVLAASCKESFGQNGSCENVSCPANSFCFVYEGSPECFYRREPDLCAREICTNNSSCVVLNGEAACCPNSCPQTWQPVCGNNGVTYANACELRSAGCARGRKIIIAARGRCQRSGNNCPFLDCAAGSPQVCGTDNVTYTNTCELQMAACRNGTNVEVAHAGRC